MSPPNSAGAQAQLCKLPSESLIILLWPLAAAFGAQDSQRQESQRKGACVGGPQEPTAGWSPGLGSVGPGLGFQPNHFQSFALEHFPGLFDLPL